MYDWTIESTSSSPSSQTDDARSCCRRLNDKACATDGRGGRRGGVRLVRLGDGGEYRSRDLGITTIGEGATRRSRSHDEGVDGRVLPFTLGGVRCLLVTAVYGLVMPVELYVSKLALQD